MPPAPADSAARPRDRSRVRRTDRPWYVYAEQVLPEPAEAGRWVDLGCGAGEFLERAARAGLSGMGLDYWRENALRALQAGRPAAVADLNRPLPFRDGSLDGVTLIEVIEHIVAAEALAGELARVIRPGGWLVVTTPNVAHWTYRWRALTGHPPKQEGYHLRFFTRRTLEATLVAAGFRRRSSRSFGKQALLTRMLRWAGRDRSFKLRYRVPEPCEALLARHFVWRLERSRP